MEQKTNSACSPAAAVGAGSWVPVNIQDLREQLYNQARRDAELAAWKTVLCPLHSTIEETTMSIKPAEGTAEGTTSAKFGNTVPPHYDLGGPHQLQWHDIRELLMDKLDNGGPHIHHASDIIAWDRALEYLVRAPFKNGVDDLLKARHYLNMLIAQIEERE